MRGGEISELFLFLSSLASLTPFTFSSSTPYIQVSNEDFEIEELHPTDRDVEAAVGRRSSSLAVFPAQQIIVLLVLALVEPINYSQKTPNIPQVIIFFQLRRPLYYSCLAMNDS